MMNPQKQAPLKRRQQKAEASRGHPALNHSNNAAGVVTFS